MSKGGSALFIGTWEQAMEHPRIDRNNQPGEVRARCREWWPTLRTCHRHESPHDEAQALKCRCQKTFWQMLALLVLMDKNERLARTSLRKHL